MELEDQSISTAPMMRSREELIQELKKQPTPDLETEVAYVMIFLNPL